jgi:hypothetical protein
MTLTTKFELLVDVSAGVLALAKLIPVVATPTAELSGDYYHQIQIIFHGNNAIAKGTFSRVAKRSARPRVGSAPGTGGDDTATAVLKELRAIRDATILNAHP